MEEVKALEEAEDDSDWTQKNDDVTGWDDMRDDLDHSPMEPPKPASFVILYLGQTYDFLEKDLIANFDYFFYFFAKHAVQFQDQRAHDQADPFELKLDTVLNHVETSRNELMAWLQWFLDRRRTIAFLCEHITDWYALYQVLDYLQFRQPARERLEACLNSEWGYYRQRAPWPSATHFWSFFLARRKLNMLVAFQHVTPSHETFAALGPGLLELAADQPSKWSFADMCEALQQWSQVHKQTYYWNLMDPLVQHHFNTFHLLDDCQEQQLSKEEKDSRLSKVGQRIWVPDMLHFVKKLQEFWGPTLHQALYYQLKANHLVLTQFWDVLFEPWVRSRGHQHVPFKVSNQVSFHGIHLIGDRDKKPFFAGMVKSFISLRGSMAEHAILAIPGLHKNVIFHEKTEAAVQCGLYFDGDGVWCDTLTLLRITFLHEQASRHVSRNMLLRTYGFSVPTHMDNDHSDLHKRVVFLSHCLLSVNPTPEERFGVKSMLKDICSRESRRANHLVRQSAFQGLCDHLSYLIL